MRKIYEALEIRVVLSWAMAQAIEAHHEHMRNTYGLAWGEDEPGVVDALPTWQDADDARALRVDHRFSIETSFAPIRHEIGWTDDQIVDKVA